jgi:hypothetical protein
VKPRLPRCSIRPEIRAVYEELNRLTRENNKEYGMVICKNGSEITAGRFCVGEQCQLDIRMERDGCPRGHRPEQFVHTHPRTGDNFSTPDVSWSANHDIDKLCVLSPVTDSVTCLENLQRVHNYGRLFKSNFITRHDHLMKTMWDGRYEERALMLAYEDDEMEPQELKAVNKVRKAIWDKYHEEIPRITDDWPEKARIQVCTAKVE